MTPGFICPTFSSEMRIVDGIHPLLENNIQRNIAIPNNAVRNKIELNSRPIIHLPNTFAHDLSFRLPHPIIISI